MTTREYLNQIRLLNIKINQRIQEAAELKQKAMSASSIDTSKEPVQTSARPDAATRMIDRYVEMEQEIDHLIDHYVEMKHRIIGEIQSLNNQRSVNLLYKRYVEFKSFKQIAKEMHYSYDHTRGLHSRALWEFWKFHKR